ILRVLLVAVRLVQSALHDPGNAHYCDKSFPGLPECVSRPCRAHGYKGPDAVYKSAVSTGFLGDGAIARVALADSRHTPGNAPGRSGPAASPGRSARVHSGRKIRIPLVPFANSKQHITEDRLRPQTPGLSLRAFTSPRTL